MKRASTSQRGSALLVAMGIVVFILLVVVSIVTFSGNERVRAAGMMRSMKRLSCAEGGLELARAFYGRNFASWNSYLSQPEIYNPFPASWEPSGPSNPYDANLQSTHPELFADLDGDGAPDVYIYIRDNVDELKSQSANNPFRDNDQNVFVGAICISRTMTPPRDWATPADAGLLNAQYVEGLLQFNQANGSYKSELCGNTGSGNCNH